ncbi:MAG: hypothetical protein AAGC95_02750 [Pseudomonadota bacterium]
MKQNKGTDKDTRLQEQHTNQKSSLPMVTVDFEYYEKYLSDYEITDEQKRKFIEIMANIMMGFVDLGFGIAPGQILCGEDESACDLSSKNGGNPVYSETLSKTFNYQDATLLCVAEENDS